MEKLLAKVEELRRGAAEPAGEPVADRAAGAAVARAAGRQHDGRRHARGRSRGRTLARGRAGSAQRAGAVDAPRTGAAAGRRSAQRAIPARLPRSSISAASSVVADFRRAFARLRIHACELPASTSRQFALCSARRSLTRRRRPMPRGPSADSRCGTLTGDFAVTRERLLPRGARTRLRVVDQRPDPREGRQRLHLAPVARRQDGQREVGDRSQRAQGHSQRGRHALGGRHRRGRGDRHRERARSPRA